jgi:hypothetical protein
MTIILCFPFLARLGAFAEHDNDVETGLVLYIFTFSSPSRLMPMLLVSCLMGIRNKGPSF